jgi:hypothetical protein
MLYDFGMYSDVVATQNYTIELVYTGYLIIYSQAPMFFSATFITSLTLMAFVVILLASMSSNLVVLCLCRTDLERRSIKKRAFIIKERTLWFAKRLGRDKTSRCGFVTQKI